VEAWEAYFADHPEVHASWNHQNGCLPPEEYYHLVKRPEPVGELDDLDDDEDC
jgi:hypothetical protein